MTVDDVQTAIGHAMRAIEEWKQSSQHLDGISWREVHTRYAIVDPILRALGWKTEDPKECHPEYPRAASGGRVDYALFGSLDLQDLPEEGIPVPDIIIEVKSLATTLTDPHIRQLLRYVSSPPRMIEGAAVLTNGVIWRIYKIQDRTSLLRSAYVEVDIRGRDRRRAAEVLHEHLHRQRWPRLGHT